MPMIDIMVMYAEVAPFTGAWIEMPYRMRGEHVVTVAPFTGAWIEITLGAP